MFLLRLEFISNWRKQKKATNYGQGWLKQLKTTKTKTKNF
jgi:hypothetical protein